MRRRFKCACMYVFGKKEVRKDFSLTSHALFVMVNSEKDNPSNDFPILEYTRVF